MGADVLDVVWEILRAGQIMNFALAKIVWAADEPPESLAHQVVRWDSQAVAYKVIAADGDDAPYVDENLWRRERGRCPQGGLRGRVEWTTILACKLPLFGGKSEKTNTACLRRSQDRCWTA